MTQRSRRGPITCALVAAAVLMAACGTSPKVNNDQPPPVQETSYCGYQDGDDFVVDPDACDDDGDGHGHFGSYIFVSGHNSHPAGTRISKTQIKGTPIPWNNSTARQGAGLPPSGKVGTGQRTNSPAGIGSGNTGGNSTGG